MSKPWSEVIRDLSRRADPGVEATAFDAALCGVRNVAIHIHEAGLGDTLFGWTLEVTADSAAALLTRIGRLPGMLRTTSSILLGTAFDRR